MRTKGTPLGVFRRAPEIGVSHPSSRAPWWLLGALLVAGCARQPVVAVDSLPVKRVVVYRNGVAYFERSGHVDQDEVRFRMKPAEVGDFLATLAVMERGGSSVRSAAFPIHAGDDDAPDEPSKGEKTAEKAPSLETVVLSLDGKAHDLQVGYVAESPVWRPSYRLVVLPDGRADLQAWGIVQNLSGEDWTQVRLSLIAGAPLAFRAELGVPVVPPRPTVSDEGEVIAAVPHGETSLRQEPAPASPAPAPKAAADADDDEEPPPVADDAPEGKKRRAPSTRALKSQASFGAGGPAAAAEPALEAPAPPPPVSRPRNVAALAAVALEGGTTRYDLPAAVTIPDKSATMVMLLSREVPGQSLFLFAPDGGVPDSASHPFRVARFTNQTGGVLERGPIAVFEEGAFLGQGMLDPLPGGATATVPFALERAIAVDQERKYDELGERVAKIENSSLTVERDQVTQTIYRVRNGGDHPANLIVKHARVHGARLVAPPAGTDDNVGTGAALVPVAIGPRATSELRVDERVPVRRPVDWLSPIADRAVHQYLSSPISDRDVVAKLGAAWTLRDDMAQKSEQLGKLQEESGALGASSEETRRNLRAIEKNRTAEALRAKLTARLAEVAAHLDEVNRKSVELVAKLAEARIQFNEAIRDLRVVAVTPPG